MHEDGDYILDDDKEVEITKEQLERIIVEEFEALLSEKKKKKKSR